jgi:hypothetical protein
VAECNGAFNMTADMTTTDLSRRTFVLQEVQPALLGLMDGSVSTLAPIFAAAGLTGRAASTFFVGLAASLGPSDEASSPVRRPGSEECFTPFLS